MPLSFFVLVGLVAVVVVIPVTLKLAGAVLGRRRQLCPGCSHKTLAMTGGSLVARSTPAAQPTSWAEYECEHCQAQFVKPLGAGLMTRQAWNSGASEQIPTAIVVKREET